MDETIDLVPLNGQSILSVSELSQRLKKTIETNFSYVRVRGEVSGLKRHTSGHTYFALKDMDAVMDAVSWRGMLPTSGVQLEDGLEIIATGRLTSYPGRSKYQMIVTAFEAAGVGALLKQLEERKQRLAQEGLFAPERKKSLPVFPQTIAVITSPTGAVIRDILHRIRERFPCHVIVWPVAVQGVGAAEQITAAIDGFNTMTIEPRPDLIIVARGGGSLEDLWAFNEEIVVRAAARSNIPLISAVGHETDTTLIDFAADQRAPTPTAAAEIAVPVLSELWHYLQDRHQRLHSIMQQHLSLFMMRVTSLSRGLPDPKQLIEDKMQRLDDWQERLSKAMAFYQQSHHEKMINLAHRLRHPQNALDVAFEKLTTSTRWFHRVFHHQFEQYQGTLEQISGRLGQAAYQRQLERGFCHVTTETGKAISNAKDVRPQYVMNLHFHDGVVPVMAVSRPPKKSAKKTAQEDQPTLF